MRLFIKLLSISLLFVLAGCSEERTQLLIKDLPHYTPDANDGFLIGSFVYEVRDKKTRELLAKQVEKLHNIGISFNVIFRGTENRKLYCNVIDSEKKFFELAKIRTDFDIPGGKGQFFLVPLPAGKYVFSHWKAYVGQYSTFPSSSQEPYSIPFEIKPNEVVYAGQTKAVIFFSKFIILSPEYVTIEFDNQYQRDYPEIKNRFQFIENCPTKIIDLEMN